MKRIFLILPLLMMTACSCEKRVAHLAGRCPECFEKIIIFDTVATSSQRIDTVFVAKNTVDTFVLDHDRVRLEIIKQVDTFATTLHLKPDTIIRTLQVPAPHPVAEPDEQTFMHKASRLMRPALWLFAFMIVTIIYLIRKKKY